MPSAEYLKQFVSDRLAAAAEEIFAVFHKSIFDYEEELERHRKLFDVAWKPVVRLRRTELPQQLVLREGLIVDDQSSLNQDRNSSVAQEELELPQIKEQQEELSSSDFGLKQELEDLQLHSADGGHCRSGDTAVDWKPEVSQPNSELQQLSSPPAFSQTEALEEGEDESGKNPVSCHLNGCEFPSPGPSPQPRGISTAKKPHVSLECCKNINELELKQESEDLQLCSTDEKSNKSENPTVDWNPQEPFQESEVKIPVITSVVSEANSNLSLHSGFSTSQGQTEDECENSKSPRPKRKDPDSNFHKNDQNVAVPKSKTPFTENRCHKEFEYESKVQKHRKTPKRPHKCQEYDKHFDHNSNLTTHKKNHTSDRPHVCLTCGKKFANPSILKSHKTIHTGERPYVCLTCDKGFRRKAHLTEHEMTHTGERPHVCQECKRGFSSKNNLIRHIRIHTGERQYVCQTCGKGFIQKYYLKLHEKIHTPNQQLFSAAVENGSRDASVVEQANTELQQQFLPPAVSQSQAQRKAEQKFVKNPLAGKTEKFKLLSRKPLLRDKVIMAVKRPHVCQVCSKTFLVNSDLIKHIRIHTGEKPFVCQTCGKRFSQTSHLNQHKRLHTSERPWKCKQCGKDFKTSAAYRYHEVMVH